MCVPENMARKLIVINAVCIRSKLPIKYSVKCKYVEAANSGGKTLHPFSSKHFAVPLGWLFE
jgi:hypothetical protein